MAVTLENSNQTTTVSPKKQMSFQFFNFILFVKQSMKEMDELIKAVNRLQDVFASINVSNPIDLPQIVVIGR